MAVCSKRISRIVAATCSKRRSYATTAWSHDTRCDLSSSDSQFLDLSKFNKETANVNSDDFVLYPKFYDQQAQSILLKGCLEKLRYSVTTPEDKIARREYATKLRQTKPLKRRTLIAEHAPFHAEEGYYFRTAHDDGVISNFRETTVSEWREKVDESHENARFFQVLLRQAYNFFPEQMYHPAAECRVPPNLLAHVLHLSTQGYIDEHVDNIEASGNLIVGISLGSDRVMHLRQKDGDNSVSALLPAGSVYIQKGNIRYDYLHSIPNMSNFKGKGDIGGGPRVSIMLRDRLPSQST